MDHIKTILKPMTWRAPWYEQNPKRLKQEEDAMRARFPGFVLTRGNDARLGWDGELSSNRGNTYRVIIEYPDDFPYSEPGAFILNPRFESQHMYRGGRLCLMYPKDDTWQTNTSCATIVAIVATWIFAYESHREKCRRGPGNKPCMDPQCPHWPGPKL